MRSVVKHAVGKDGVRLMEMPEPSLLPGHVIVEVEAAGICGTDLHIQQDEYPSNPPVILGHEFSGSVVDVAPDASAALLGQRVTCMPFFITCGKCEACRLGRWNLCPERKSVGSGVNGAFARYILVPERSVRPLPDNVDFVAGAVTEPLACCTHALQERASIRPTDTVVVLGPGAIGQLAAQVAVAAGARVVIAGIGVDEERLQLAKRLGAHQAINTQEQSLSSAVKELTAGWGADVVVECSGSAGALRLGYEVIKPGGQMVQIGLFGGSIQSNPDVAVIKEVSVFNSFASTWTSWQQALQLMARGQVRTWPLVTSVLPLEQWEDGFSRFRSKQGVKFVLMPKA